MNSLQLEIVPNPVEEELVYHLEIEVKLHLTVDKNVKGTIMNIYRVMCNHAKVSIHTDKKISDRLPYLPYKMTTFRTVKKLVKNDAKLIIFLESIKI